MNNNKIYYVIVVGAGASGIGMGVLFLELGIENYLILEKGHVGQTFLSWTKETKFISPSFNSNMFNIPDINSVTPLTSPTFNFNTEHPAGTEYSNYLKLLVEHYNLKIRENIEIVKVEKSG